MKKINIYPNSGNRVYVNDLQDINNDIISAFGRAFGPQFDGLAADVPFFISGGEWSGYMVDENPSSLFWTSGLLYYNGNIYNIAQSSPTTLDQVTNVYGYGVNESQRNPESGNPYYWNTNYLGYYASAPRDASHTLLISGINVVPTPWGTLNYNFPHYNPYLNQKQLSRDAAALNNKIAANTTNIATNTGNIATNTAAITALNGRLPAYRKLVFSPQNGTYIGPGNYGTIYNITVGEDTVTMLSIKISIGIRGDLAAATTLATINAVDGQPLPSISGNIVAVVSQPTSAAPVAAIADISSPAVSGAPAYLRIPSMALTSNQSVLITTTIPAEFPLNVQ